MTKISVVIPCYYSEKTIASVVESTIEEFKKLKKYQYEFILVNDGSEDGTFLEIIKLAEKYYPALLDLPPRKHWSGNIDKAAKQL